MNLFGMLASLFSPFWYLDAKGGEVVLFRMHVGFARVGHKLLAFFIRCYELVPMYLSLVELCDVWCKTYNL